MGHERHQTRTTKKYHLEGGPALCQGVVYNQQELLVVDSEEVEQLVRLGLLDVEICHHVLELSNLKRVSINTRDNELKKIFCICLVEYVDTVIPGASRGLLPGAGLVVAQ